MRARAGGGLVLTGLRVGLALLAGITAVQAQGNASVAVSDAWARATPPHAATGAAYLTLTSPAADTLVGVSSPVAAEAELHSMTMEGNVMRMRPVEGGLDLPAGKPVTLAPGGTHVMLMGLRAPLKQGQGVMLHLTFRNAPPEDVTARVEALGAKGPPAGGSGQGSMAGMPMH